MADKQFNKKLKEYIKEINSYLICDWRTRNKFIRDLKNDIDEYIENDSITDFDSVYNRFGNPESIAKGFLENTDTKKIKRRMNITRVIVIGVIIALVMWGLGITAVILDAHSDNNGYDITYFDDEINQQMQLIDFEGLL